MEGKSFMGKAKEHAKRALILLAVAGMIFSSVAITVIYFVQQKDGSSTQQADIQKQIQEQLKQQQEAKMPKEPLTGYEATPFDKEAVTELKVETLKQGDGAVASPSSTVKANDFGWTSDGKIFDSSQRGGTATPIEFPLNQVIKGWTEGLTGVKQGSVVKLLIPAEKAYGAQDMGDGRPFGPLAFIVELTEVK